MTLKQLQVASELYTRLQYDNFNINHSCCSLCLSRPQMAALQVHRMCTIVGGEAWLTGHQVQSGICDSQELHKEMSLLEKQHVDCFH